MIPLSILFIEAMYDHLLYVCIQRTLGEKRSKHRDKYNYSFLFLLPFENFTNTTFIKLR